MRRVVVALGMLVAGHTLAQETVTVPELVATIQASHPYLAAAAEQGRQRQLAVQSADSAFDPLIEQETNTRVSGYYDGAIASQRFVKPLQSMNARLYSEYRLADGDFPVYEQEYETLSGGEASLGVMMSLLRYREIDKRRLGLRNAQLAVEQWRQDYQNDVNEMIFKGVKDYLYWYETALQVQAVSDLLDALARRRDAIASRVEQGDLAESDLIEFDANALQQELVLAELKRKLAVTQRALAFYLRDDQGQMKDTSSIRAGELAWPYQARMADIVALRRSLASHPVLAALEQEKRMLTNKASLAKTSLLPKLDLKASVARDIGSGAASLDGTETKVGLSFSYPLGNRAAKAELSSIESKQTQLDHKIQLAADSIVQAFEKAYQHWQQTVKIAEMQQKNASLADQLYDMEIKRYDAGDTDMFVLNARESSQIRARMKQIKADIDVYLAELALYHAAARLELNIRLSSDGSLPG
ncbi:TolC family protein [Alteromonas sp. CYL-A6]|uniref:TolC family protein n=1 Tax=Alteromonas nitratireducens TaxID=3390813 RepID=UPI0034A96AFC